ncbi:uncharacterized protein PV09_04213 [Verruconis gallopava]|uniref:Nephrocystin 3-like N-terminal domain-containing protein n=1 Tax=Verruconis gallopava TaxID=253628 RepID=A0A0D2ADK8_9PEZI|nr:uncharacterized protein PV09_04213 [Verruconis gallopava]KIW05058.1 hypothetical protein PV09_04213 [Verruconis gallopava]
MAEAATIIQLVQFSAAVVSCCYAYIQKAKNAPAEITAIIDELTAVRNILEQLQKIAQNPHDERYSILKSLGRPNGAFPSALDTLAELETRIKILTDASGLRKRLQWPLESRGVDKLLERISALKADFYLALAGDISTGVDRVEDAVEEISGKLDDLKSAEEKQKILSWLSGPDPSVTYNNARAKREPGTCEWLLKADEFQSWFTRGGQLLWLHGFPGAGKTFLSTAVIEYLKNQHSNTPCTIAYYYFDFRNTLNQSASGLLCSIIQQICQHRKSTPPALSELYEECRGGSPSNEQLIDVLKTLAIASSRIFMVVDALDECPGQDTSEREYVLALLEELKNLGANQLSVYVASRPETDIKERMKQICDIEVDVHLTSINNDIRLHVRSCLSKKDDKLNRWPPNIKQEIEDKLMEKAGGMFRWAACQLAELRKCLKPAQIRAELNKLPKTLDETYARILSNVPEMYRSELRAALIFLAFSARPMTIQEIAEATSINVANQSFSVDDRFCDAYDLLEICSSLVSLTEIPKNGDSPFRREGVWYSNSIWNDPTWKVLQFAHFSVKEYLLAERTQGVLPKISIVNEALAHEYITKACLIYLLEFNGGKRLLERDFKAFPLLAYSALYWSNHFSSIRGDERDDSIKLLLLRLFDPNNQNHLLNLLNLYDPQHWRNELSMGATKRSTKDFQPPLYYASYYGLVPVVKALIETIQEDENQLEVLNLALVGASRGGQPEVIDILLASGADVKATICGDLLKDAAESGVPDAVKKLIDAGAPVKDGELYEGDALHTACITGQSESVQLLLDHGFDMHKRSQRYGTPLSAALLKNHQETVKVLMCNGADVNFPAEGGWNPLAVAAEHSCPELVRLLLEKGAKIAPMSNPLAEAAKRGDLDVVKLLLKHGANINGFTDDFYGTALKGAIQSRNTELLDFVLQAGADIHQRGGDEMYPVDMAIFSGNVAAAEKLLNLGATFGPQALEEALDFSFKYHLVPILLAKGANPNEEHEKFGSILQYAIARSDFEQVRHLVEAGADVNGLQGQEGGQPLQMAAAKGDEKLVRLLLDRGASVNPDQLYGEYGDPLSAAVWCGHDVIVDILLDAGAALDRSGENYNPPLHGAAKGGNLKMVQHLMNKGAPVNLVSGSFSTALRAAISYGHIEIVSFLLDCGADLNFMSKGHHSTKFFQYSDQDTISALDTAVATNDILVVQLLLDRGLSINASEEAAVKSLNFALRMSGIHMLEFLISKGIDVVRFGGKAFGLDWWPNNCQIFAKTKIMVARGAQLPLDAKDGEGRPFLLVALDRPDYDLFEYLLNRGADPNVTERGDLRGSALNIAVEQRRIDIIENLLAKGADVNLSAGYWGSPFVNVIAKGDEELYQLFLAHGADVNPKVDEKSISATTLGTPLEVAISKGYYDIAHDLIDRGADVHNSLAYGSLLVPALNSVGVGQPALIRRLLSLHADVNACDREREGESSFTLRQTPLQAAVRAKNNDMISLLIEHGANINPEEPSGTYGYPLQAAAHYGYVEQIRFLIDRGASLNAVGGKFGTALQAAAAEGSDAVIKMLLDAGADAMIEGGCYGSALQAASWLGVYRQVKLLLELGVPVNTQSGKYGNPLAAAAKRANRDVVELLLAAGADVNLEGGKYGTPLQAACCSKGSSAKRFGKGIIELFIEKGADLNPKASGKYGSPIQAAACHSRSYVDILISHGANPNVQGGKYGSAIAAAQATKAFDTERLLARHLASNG